MGSEFEIVCKNGYQFTRDGSLVLVQKVFEDGSLSKGTLAPLFGWDLAEFAAEYEQLKHLQDSDVLADLREAQWEADAFARDEAYEYWLEGGAV